MKCDVEVEVEVTCECGEPLTILDSDWDQGKKRLAVTVEKCQLCAIEARDRGRREGGDR